MRLLAARTTQAAPGRVRLAVVLVGIAAAACGSSTAPSARATLVARPASGLDPVLASERADHRVITLHRGQQLEVRLHSTYWHFRTPTAGVLSTLGPPVYAPLPLGRCLPGAGCGTVTARFRAVRPGRATVTARRSSCGEAIACLRGAGRFILRVNVVSG